MHISDISPDFEIKNRLIYDWVSFTTKKHSVTEIVELLGLRNCPFETVNGSKGFRYREYFNGISIHFNEQQISQSGEFVWLEMSGQGCRTFETYGSGDYEGLFALARGDPTNIHLTRLDVAFDEFTGLFDIDQICEYTKNEYFTSRIKNHKAIFSNGGNSVEFGSRMSNVLIRIYDKAAERGYDNKKFHWIRCELQLKDCNALGFANKANEIGMQETYLGVLKNYLIFREPCEDSNKRRWEICDFWYRFLDDAVRLSIWSKPGVDYNLTRCERYVLTQPVGSIKTLIEIHGEEGFLDMIKNAPAPKNPKYRSLIKQALESTKFLSDHAALEKMIELTSDSEVEFLAEIQDGFRDVKRLVELKKLENMNSNLMKRIKNDLARDKK